MGWSRFRHSDGSESSFRLTPEVADASYDVGVPLVPSSFRSYLNEPAVADPPARVWRDWVLVALASCSTVLESLLRTDAEWTSVAFGWRVGSVIAFFVAAPLAILYRRTHPLRALLWAFVPTIAFGVLVAVLEGRFGGVITTAVVLVVPYALYRWGSGRDGAIGVVVLFGAWLAGNLLDPSVVLSDWIGGFIVLTIPVEAGLIVRYRHVARVRMISEATMREREDIARELHDTVAHHVSAIAVQAQAGQVVAQTDPQRAVEVLAVIEQAASRTLSEMRAMVGSLRGGADADMTPQRGVDDLVALARSVPDGVTLDVKVDSDLADVGPAVDAALYRIAQESITNAVRHAKRASRVEVRVESSGDGVRLSVVDDGHGSDGEHHGQGYGLLGMAERAHLLGGTFSAGPTGSKGWRVDVELPLAGRPS
jgi:signal transduction histidine kinase